MRNSQIYAWNTNFFPRQAIPKILFVLHSIYPGDTPYRFWFGLNNSLTRWKRPIFKIPFSRNSNCSVWKTDFFPRQAIPKTISVSPSNYTWDTPYRVWFDLNNSLTQWNRPIFKIRYLRKSQISYEKLTFFLGKLYQKFFSFYTLDTLVILHAEFGLIWTTPWPNEIDLFSKFVICEIRKFPYEKLTFFLGQLYQKFFLFYNLHTLGILHTKFGSLWTTLWPNQKDLFLKLLIQNFTELIRNFRRKANFFPSQAIPKSLTVLHSQYPWDTPCRVWSDLDNSLTQWNRPIFKTRYLRNSQISVWNTNFFPRQAIPKILFVLHSTYPGDTPYEVWFFLDNSVT